LSDGIAAFEKTLEGSGSASNCGSIQRGSRLHVMYGDLESKLRRHHALKAP